MSGIVGSRLNIRGSGLVGNLGTDGQVFTSSGAGAGAVFEDAAGGGLILQVVTTEVTAATASTTASSFEDTAGMSEAITPSASTSRIMVIATLQVGHPDLNSAQGRIVRLISGGSDVPLLVGDAASSRTQASFHYRCSGPALMETNTGCIIDSPSTTTSTSYRCQWQRTEASTLYLNRSHTDTDNASHPRGASTITVMEISA